MNIVVEQTKKSEIKLTIEVSAGKMEEYKKLATKELQDKVEVPGFRKGNIPMDALEKHMGEHSFMSHVLDLAISATYEEAVREKDLKPVQFPKVEIISHEPLKYSATVEVLPEVSWKKDIAKLTVARKKQEVSDKEINEVLDNLKKRTIKWNKVDRAAKKGDRAEIDFAGTDMDGKALEGTESKNHPVVLGEGSLIPGFEEEIQGMKPGEEKDFEITFPEDYHADQFKGKKVKFHIKLHQVEESEERELDDEFAKEITGGNRKTLGELKDEIKEELGKQKDMQETGRLENDFLKSIIDYVDVEVPDSLIDREIDFLIQRMQQDMQQRGMKWEDYEKEMKEKGRDVREELKKTAHDQVLIRLGLEKLYNDEKVEISDDEIQAEVEERMSHYPPQFKAMAEEQYKEGSQQREVIRNQLMLRKIVEAHTK